MKCWFFFDRHKLAFPGKVEELKILVETLKSYKEEYYYAVLILFCSAYLYKQTFSIPGSVFMVNNYVILITSFFLGSMTFLFTQRLFSCIKFFTLLIRRVSRLIKGSKMLLVIGVYNLSRISLPFWSEVAKIMKSSRFFFFFAPNWENRTAYK